MPTGFKPPARWLALPCGAGIFAAVFFQFVAGFVRQSSEPMIIIWRGLGLPIMLAGLFVTGMISAMFGLPYLMTHVWPRLLAFGIGGAVVYWLAWLRETKAGMRDSLYWIPMKVWAVIFLMFGIGSALLSASLAEARQISGAPIAAPVAKANRASVKAAAVNGFQLQGIFYNANGRSTAIVNSKTVSVGDKVGDATVSAIELKWVKLQAADGKETVLKFSDPGR